MKLISMSDVRTAKDGRQYFIGTFRPGFGQRQVNRTFWEQFKLIAGVKTTEKFWERASPSEAMELIASGETIDAAKITRNVETYDILGKAVNTYSTVIFPDENEVALFASQNHPIVSEHGEVLGKRTPKVSLAPEATPSQVAEKVAA